MGLELVVRKFAQAMADYATANGDRWSDAATKVANGTYTAAELKTDVGDSAGDVFDVWATLLTFSPGGALPIAEDSASANDYTVRDRNTVVTLESPVPVGAAVTETNVALVTDPTKTLVVNAAPQGALNDEMLVTIVKAAAAPDVGLYLGFALVDGVPAAVIRIEVTP